MQECRATPPIYVLSSLFTILHFLSIRPLCQLPLALDCTGSDLADCLCLYWKLCLISGWERIPSVGYTEDKHWRRSVISICFVLGSHKLYFLFCALSQPDDVSCFNNNVSQFNPEYLKWQPSTTPFSTVQVNPQRVNLVPPSDSATVQFFL